MTLGIEIVVPCLFTNWLKWLQIITETDKAIEELISRRVREKFPDHGFIGEETVADDGNQLLN